MRPGLRSVSFVEIVQKDGWVTSGELCSNGVLSVERGNQNGATRHGGEEIAGLYDEIAEYFKPSGYLKRLKNSFLNQVDTFHTDSTWDNVIWKSPKTNEQA